MKQTNWGGHDLTQSSKKYFSVCTIQTLGIVHRSSSEYKWSHSFYCWLPVLPPWHWKSNCLIAPRYGSPHGTVVANSGFQGTKIFHPRNDRISSKRFVDERERQKGKKWQRRNDRKTELLNGRDAKRQTDRQAGRHAKRQTDGQIDRQTDRQTDRQADMQRDRLTDR